MLEMIINSLAYDGEGNILGLSRLEQNNESLTWLNDASYDDILDHFSNKDIVNTSMEILMYALRSEFYSRHSASMIYQYNTATETSQGTLDQIEAEWQLATQNDLVLAQIHGGATELSTVPVELLYDSEIMKKLLSKMPKTEYTLMVTVNGKDFSCQQKSLDKMSQTVGVIADGSVVNFELFDGSIASVTKAELSDALSLGVTSRSNLMPIYSDQEITQLIHQLYITYFQTATTASNIS